MRVFFPIICSIILAACGQEIDTAKTEVAVPLVASQPTTVAPVPSVTPQSSAVVPFQPAVTADVPGSVKNWEDYTRVKAAAWDRYTDMKGKAWVKHADFQKAELLKLKSVNEKAFYLLIEAERFASSEVIKLMREVPEVKTAKEAIASDFQQYQIADRVAYRQYEATTEEAYRAYQAASGNKR